MADAGKKTQTAGKDMKDVIAQFQQANKGNTNLRPPAGNKPKPPTAQKHSFNEQTEGGNDTAKLPRKPMSDKQEGAGNPAASEEANPFKVALKPVTKPSGTGVTTRNAVNQKSATEIEKPVTVNNDETPETTPKVSSSIANKSKMFETQQKQPEGDTPSKPTVGGVGAATKPKFPANSNFQKPQTKPAQAADSVPKLNGTTAPSANKWNKVEGKPDESKTGVQKPDGKKEFPFRKGVQDDEAKTGDDAEVDDKLGNTNFATMRPVRSAAKPSFPATSNTLPKQPKPGASTVTKARTEPGPETEKESNNQLKIPAKPCNKAEQPKIPAKTKEDTEQPKIPARSSDKVEQPKIPAKTKEDTEQPKIPARSSDKVEQAKIPTKTTEDSDQPKIPPRRDQKKPEESATDKTAPKQPPTANRKADEAKMKKVPDQNESLLRNKGRPLPKPAEKQYRLLPVPKQKGKPPRKTAKPPVMDLSKWASYATAKSVQPVASQVSVDSYGDGDDLYEDCDNMEVITNKSSRISEYTEEEEATIEMKAKSKQNTANTDNYGKMFNTPSIDEYNDDEIYQEID